MKLLKSVLSLTAIAILGGCGAPQLVQTPIDKIDTTPLKITPLTEDQLKYWGHMDLTSDTVPGMSVNKAYAELLKGKKGKTVVVGIIDSGVDIFHEDLRDVVWKNPGEIPNNGKDDDKNGYVDDVYGWNFLGEANNENLEYVRILKKGDDGSADYKRAKAEYDKKYPEAQQNKTRYEQIYQNVTGADAVIAKHLKKTTYTKEEVVAISTQDQTVLQAKAFILQMFSFEDSISVVKSQLNEGIEYFADQLNYNLNLEFDGRKIVGDNPDDINDKNYGNNNVVGDKKHAKHGTHVAGIVAATRDNGKGINGVANHVQIMTLRAVPNGDEYDKDIALAIRYAADNGAKVINTSFGKYYSPHTNWVYDAIKYAASKDVLIVNAAGNEGYDLDTVNVFPNDAVGTGPEIADNFITIGALHHKYGPEMVANFSNYGKYNVDVFSPGTKIWSTVPDSKYDFLQGTSMASPAVAGVAALIRSYYPKLTAAQVKKVLMESGLPIKQTVILDGDPSKKAPFSTISQSGKMVNAYNALIMADKLSRGEINL